MVNPVFASALADRYLIEREIGAGGMSRVCLARDLHHGRRVALKVIDTRDAGGVQQALSELRNTARLQHPNILPVFDSGETAGLVWMSLPYLEGGSLRQLLELRGRLPVDEALPILRGIGAALQYAHDRQILHGDVKPENILLDQGHAYLADFGISRSIHADASALRAGPTPSGTPDYVSPEQASGDRAVDGRADLYSLACVAVELLSGRAPFTAASAAGILANRYLAPPDIHRMVPALSARAATVLEQALSVSPGRRQASPAEFVTQLEAAVHPHPAAWLGSSWRRLAGTRLALAGRLPAWGFDLRAATRSLRRRPGFFLAVTGTLGLAIAALTATMAVVDAILLRPLPYPEPDRLVTLCETHPSVARFCVAAPPNAMAWARQTRSFASLGLGRDWSFTLSRGDRPVSVPGGLASDELFRVFRFEPLLGRLFRPEDLGPGRRVVVLSHGLWSRAFGADTAIVGRSITLDDSAWTVVGVLRPAAEVALLEYVQLWTPLPFRPDDPSQRDWRGFTAYARLAPSVTPARALEEMRRVSRDLAREFPATNRGWDAEIRSLHGEVVGSVRGLLLLFLSATGLVLVVAAANIANLMLARASGRTRELAIQAAVGGGRARQVRTLLFESAVLAATGVALGLVLARLAVAWFQRFAPLGIPRLPNVSLGTGPLLLGVALGMLTAFLAGLVPVLRISRLDLSTALRSAGPAAGSERGWGRAALIVTQVAVAATLLIAAGLLTRSFVNLIRWNPGFDTGHLMVVATSASPGRYRTGADVVELNRQARAAIGGVAGVRGVANVSAGPLFGGLETGTFVSRDPGPRREVAARWYDATAGYFETLGLTVMRGRSFSSTDRAGSVRVAVVNETFALRLWPGEDPIGRRVVEDSPDAEVMEVVGVVRDVPPFRTGEPPSPEIWWSFDQSPRWASFLVIRTDPPPATLAPVIEARLEADLRGLQSGTFRVMPELIARRLVTPRFSLLLIAGFAVLAVLMAVVGLYGLVSFIVALRLRDVAIRIALGAAAAAVRRQVLGRSLALCATGIAIGLVAALLLGRLFQGLLAGVSPADPLTFATVPLVLLCAAGLAAWVPARRAARVDPMMLLRAE